MTLKLEDIMAAWTRIKHHIHQTPLIHNRNISELMGCEVYIKAEFLQKTGSFKARGALNFTLTDDSRDIPFTTYSSGNHGQALTWAAARLGRKAVIFMPEDASPVKVAAVKGYGGEVRFAGLSSGDRYQACTAWAAESGARVVPPYDHPAIVAGQGSAMLEVLESLPMFDAALIPVGGGGLLAGNSRVLQVLRSRIPVYACEPAAAADVSKSLASGSLQEIPYPNTIADGVRNLKAGDLNWEIIRTAVDEGLVCSEDEIRQAMGWYAVFAKQYVEPSGAVSLACLWANRERFAGKKVVVYASGGNIAISDFCRLVTFDEHPR